MAVYLEVCGVPEGVGAALWIRAPRDDARAIVAPGHE